ncbi:MAG TPA: DUF2461 family protein [Candidatus Acidoferrales bacterium]|nr:DUF2461 family protein [Candidatus Acidoferrales bacterium]
MPAREPIFSPEIFQFFQQLHRNNRKEWMDANRERYQTVVSRPFRRLLEEMTPFLLKLDGRLDVSGRGNFSRINRDIRFAKDKTPYRPQMYFKVPALFAAGETGELYLGVSAKTVTLGFRIYSGGKRKASALGVIADSRIAAKPAWLAQQRKRLGHKYESYWYATEKGSWTQKAGWPAPADWPKLQGWIVRKKAAANALCSAGLCTELQKAFRELLPLLRFTSMAD